MINRYKTIPAHSNPLLHRAGLLLMMPTALVLVLITLYQKLTRCFPRSCRFYPSCSHYAFKAFKLHGFWKGGWLTTKRIGRCHPFHPGGVDYVPPIEKQTDVFQP